MVAKIVFAFLVAFVLCQAIFGRGVDERTKRDTSADASQTINDMLNAIKTGVEDLVKNVQGNELVRNATQVLEGFAQSVEAQRKELLEKITKPAN